MRPVSFLGRSFDVYGPGEIVAWSRILDDEEAVCILNGHGTQMRGGDVLVDASLNPLNGSMRVVLNTAQAADPEGYSGSHPIGSELTLRRAEDGKAYVEVRDLGPSEVLVLTNHP